MNYEPIDARSAAEHEPGRKPGRIGKALIRLFMKRATVVATEALAEHFRLITLAGPDLKGVQWVPGQKVQIAMGSAFVARTYTPIDWDPLSGRMRILGFAHGTGPGSDWLRRMRTGDECDLFGPRASLDLGALAGPIAVMGDETSIGLAHALARHDPARSVSAVFEAGDADASRLVAQHLAIPNCNIVERKADDAHLAEIEAMLPVLSAQGYSFVLTGKAATVQRMRQSLKWHGLPSARVKTKAYWAPGKVGLD